jgi:beta-glucan synthesis-associated protein KRE6
MAPVILYRPATEDKKEGVLPPPTVIGNRDSISSSSGESIISYSSGSKYPYGFNFHGQPILVPYTYDRRPAYEQEPPEEEDQLHDPAYITNKRQRA